MRNKDLKFKWKKLEQTYEKIYQRKVLKFIKKHIKEDFRSAPVYYFLNKLEINRFRSGLPLIFAEQFGVDEKLMIPLAALCELTFSTALAQDDFYDGDSNRQGLAATHTLYGERETLLSCDYMNHKIIDVFINEMKRFKIPLSIILRIVKIINLELKRWYLSVQMELNSKGKLLKIGKKYLDDLYMAKTAHGRMLLECAVILSNTGAYNTKFENNVIAVRKYSNHLAFAGQLKNDIYDYIKHRKYRGLSDLQNGHITYPLYILLQNSSKRDQNTIKMYLEFEEYDSIIKMMENKKVFEKIVELIDYHVEEAKKSIGTRFPGTLHTLLYLWAEGNRQFSVSLKTEEVKK